MLGPYDPLVAQQEIGGGELQGPKNPNFRSLSASGSRPSFAGAL